MPAGVQKNILSIHVLVDVLSKDKLLKFSFGLDKKTDADDEESWRRVMATMSSRISRCGSTISPTASQHGTRPAATPSPTRPT